MTSSTPCLETRGWIFRHSLCDLAGHRVQRRSRCPLPSSVCGSSTSAQWHREGLRGSILDAQLSYWRRQLDALPPMLRLPTDHPRPAEQTFHGRRLEIELPAHLSERLKRHGQLQGGTLFISRC
ncbi:condensation domain-containing protein [Candidatus Entotheonella palauensis]|uniref:condensation domain-containing protein n=1 Tax=Candidatus Entotheonella palauensis TaxID=93172 RepID=UPI0021189C3A|nr:condensation domain-containing protein [Candidatus Entotheonella palauensis]